MAGLDLSWLTWHLNLGEAGKKMEQAGQKVTPHPMLLEFHSGLRQQLARLGQDTQKYDALALTLLLPVVGNGPLTADEFRKRLNFGIEKAKPEIESMSAMIDTIQSLTGALKHLGKGYDQATNIFFWVRRILKQGDLPEAERAADNQAIDKEIKNLLKLLWPPEKHHSLHSPARVREARTRYPDSPTKAVASPGSLKPQQEKEKV